MPVSIEIQGVTKRFGEVSAVEDLTFTVRPGRVTGFLGPNGAGKTTTLRILLGLVTATAGSATFGGARYGDLPSPLGTVGAALEAASFHPGRSARDFLRVHAAGGGIDAGRVDVVLQMVGMTTYADRRVGGYSLGMRQRLGLAAALLGDPDVLVLDEPTNGLDPEGIRWTREFLRAFAGTGRTVLVSSHLLAEVQQMVDDVVVLANGRLVYSGTLEELASREQVTTRVRAADAAALAAALTAAGIGVRDGGGELLVDAMPETVGQVAFRAGQELHLLAPLGGGLEELFLRMTGGER
ncbi:ABC-2 type transport system ATP-binding protein [Salana multivorans]|uniref:ABC-2 type transport system ATP-binding protein n=1 Tax=Salana multivorans TaxID=120377 RepID=A0A3N2D1K2_9MICO|nr:ATP-binding cassette domain-containing protein [Salana multivorans]MBN8883795.1 ATP-binding cassette domain-containing protein [Salana multivorans]OJX93768.1 MAG: ABC transporter ATP-binding protein [Micrococcales bacterium 73-15]ROR93354.1 ABC-2 type transport system ATP-binding protein [Salana multivorans]